MTGFDSSRQHRMCGDTAHTYGEGRVRNAYVLTYEKNHVFFWGVIEV
jgi:hypothetical protein